MTEEQTGSIISRADRASAEQFRKLLIKPVIGFHLPEDADQITQQRVEWAGRAASFMIRLLESKLNHCEGANPYTAMVIKVLIARTLRPFADRYNGQQDNQRNDLQFVLDLASLHQARAKALDNLRVIIDAHDSRETLETMKDMLRQLKFYTEAWKNSNCPHRSMLSQNQDIPAITATR